MTSSAVPAGSIVVGIDGSSGSGQALTWAVEAAALEHRPLVLVHSAHLGTGSDAMWMGQPGIDVGGILEEMQAAGRTLVEDAERRALDRAPDLTVRQVLSPLDARSALLELAETAAAVVVGSRGHGPIASLLLGSVSVAVSKHAVCPVVVVRHPEGSTPRGGVLVDVDGTAECLRAIEFAYRTAAFRSLPLTAMHVFWDGGQREVTDDEPGLDDARMLLSESVAGMREKFSEVDDRLLLVRGARDRQLVRASRDMDLVVVGARQRGFFDELVHGSVAPTVVEHAGCDVAVVPCGDLAT